MVNMQCRNGSNKFKVSVVKPVLLRKAMRDCAALAVVCGRYSRVQVQTVQAACWNEPTQLEIPPHKPQATKLNVVPAHRNPPIPCSPKP